MLALDDNLISQYISFQKAYIKGYDKTVISKLFKYIQPFTISVQQKDNIKLNDEIAKALSDSGLIKIRSRQNRDDLIQKTELKLMLTKDKSYYPYINILNDEIDVSFSATYKSGENRDKAKNHIKALLSDSSEINIYDRYLSSNSSWNINKQVLFDILPLNDININIFCEYNWTNNKKNELKNYCNDWIIEKKEWNRDIHDRYIETDKIVILLSSGVINLASTLKDFTYIIKIKKDNR